MTDVMIILVSATDKILEQVGAELEEFGLQRLKRYKRRRHKDFNEKAKEVTDIYKQILSDNSSRPLAHVISCIAADSAQNKYERPRSPSSIKSEPVLGVNVSGALIGAALGLNAGGVKGDR
jgi:hypothetical protein